MPQKPRIYTPDEADRIIPRFADLLPELRAIRDRVVQVKNSCDIEEVASYGSEGVAAKEAKEKMDQYRSDILTLERDFEKRLKLFEEIGCELKNLDPGQVDFYAEKGDELIYLCWKEGEDRIAFWHTLTGGFAGRQPLV